MPNIRENIQKNIVHYRKEAKLKQADLAKLIGISSSTLASWEQGRSMPDIDKLYEISQVLGVDLITISGFTLSDKSPKPAEKEQFYTCASQLTPDEQELLADYRAFNPEGQEKVRDYIADLKGNPKYKKRPEPVMDKQA